MRKVERYQTKDGALFDDKDEAFRHEALLDFSGWYEMNAIYGRYEGCKIEWEDLIEWLKLHKKSIRSLLELL